MMILHQFFYFKKTAHVLGVIILSLICLLACGEDKNIITDFSPVWGEISFGVRLSIDVDHAVWKEEEPINTDINLENVSENDIEFEGIFIFQLIDSQGFVQYHAPFDFIEKQYNIDRVRATEVIISKGCRLQKNVDISSLGWVIPIQSSPPQFPFYQLVNAGTYTLRLDVEILHENSPNTWLCSNELEVKMMFPE